MYNGFHIRRLPSLIRRGVRLITPEWAALGYHFILALIALVMHRHPSRRLIVIGITGTKGKTSTALYLHTALSAAGMRTGLLSTAEIRIGSTVYPNTRHMTMPGRGFVQKQLRRMVKAGCTHVVVEAPSEGMRQYRDLGVRYDAVVFTNLSPEHLVTHKTFERYRDAKCRLFRRHASGRVKHIQGKPVPRLVLINADDEHGEYMYTCARSPNSSLIRFGLSERAEVRALMEDAADGASFTVAGNRYTLPYPGALSVSNALPAVIIADHYTDAPPVKSPAVS